MIFSLHIFIISYIVYSLSLWAAVLCLTQLSSRPQHVFSASELPGFFPIPQHLEMAFLPAPPRTLFFCCLTAPTSTGGETCLCDFKEVYNQLDPAVRQKFEDKGVSEWTAYVHGVWYDVLIHTDIQAHLYTLDHNPTASHPQPHILIALHGHSLTPSASQPYTLTASASLPYTPSLMPSASHPHSLTPSQPHTLSLTSS